MKEGLACLVDVRRLKDPYTALGIALHFLSRRAPFSGFNADVFVSTVDGQIRREHYLLAFEGQKVAGYLGWALFDEATSNRIIETGEIPTNEMAQTFARTGTVGWVLTAAAINTASLKEMLRIARKMYPGIKIMGVRHRKSGKATVLKSRDMKGLKALQAAEDKS